MGYHPETMVCSFPPYSRRAPSKLGERAPWSLTGALYALKPWIGFDIWHIDPEKPGTGNRTDDSCGWFDRSPGEYADAVRYVLADKEAMHEIERALATRAEVTGPYGHTYPRMPLGETLAVCLMVTRYLELRRWWNGQSGDGGAHASWRRRLFTKARNVDGVAYDLALNPIDNLSSVEEPDGMVRLLAGAMNRKFRPWWAHPRWHVHHWQIHFDLGRNLKRMFQPCATCRKPLGFGYCPVSNGTGLHHAACLGISFAPSRLQHEGEKT